MQNRVFAALLAHWRLAAPDVIAHDFGGATALRAHFIDRSDYRSLTLIDATLMCEEPRIGPWRKAIRARVAEIAGVPAARVSVKATTTERLGFTGRKEGIAAMALATVRLPVPEDDA